MDESRLERNCLLGRESQEKELKELNRKQMRFSFERKGKKDGRERNFVTVTFFFTVTFFLAVISYLHSGFRLYPRLQLDRMVTMSRKLKNRWS